VGKELELASLLIKVTIDACYTSTVRR